MDFNLNEEVKNPLVLIVDDVSQNLKILGDILRAKGYRIAVATNGKQALEVVKKILPDLILLDIMMPEMDGFAACKRLKESPRTKDIPIIFLTAKIETADIVKGLELGAVDYISKPFNSTELLARVNTHLELKKARDREKELIEKLKEALSKVKRLSGLLPICARCKNIRDDKGYWQNVEEYLSEHSEAQLSHSLCPDCVKELYPEMAEKILHKGS
ncbi:MAG: response regulator [Candidatus Aminicenantes bacterium]|nr:MAG: response regulator [Candidatus Aminicenantes bacterium]